MSIIRYPLGDMDNNTYLIIDDATGAGAVVDPSFGSEAILPDIMSRVSSLDWILLTHAHFDHIVGNAFYVRETGAVLALHHADLPFLKMLPEQGQRFGFDLEPSPEPSVFLVDNQIVQVGQLQVKVMFTPGHAPGHVSFVIGNDVICGDCLFQNSIGRTDLPGSSLQTLMDSIGSRLLTLPDETVVHPGHGDPTTIGEERRNNPYLQKIR